MSDEPRMAAAPWYAIGQLQRAFDSLAAGRDAADRAERPTLAAAGGSLAGAPGRTGSSTRPRRADDIAGPWGLRFVPALGGLAVRW
jgi:hypothetical protein